MYVALQIWRLAQEWDERKTVGVVLVPGPRHFSPVVCFARHLRGPLGAGKTNRTISLSFQKKAHRKKKERGPTARVRPSVAGLFLLESEKGRLSAQARVLFFFKEKEKKKTKRGGKQKRPEKNRMVLVVSSLVSVRAHAPRGPHAKKEHAHCQTILERKRTHILCNMGLHNGIFFMWP